MAKFIAVSSASESDNFRNLITNNIEKMIESNIGDEIYIDYANNNVETQHAQIKSFVEAGADAIIILAASSDEKQNRKIFEYATQVPLIFVNSEPVNDLQSMPKNTLYVGSNELESGTMQMEELARLAGYKGNVALLIGDKRHAAASMRTQDVKDVLSKYPQMSLIISESGHWQRNQGYSIVSKWLNDKIDFDILVANNDEMILGGIQALKEAGIDPKTYLTGGIDATRDALLEIEKGNLDVTVLQDAKGQAEATAELSYRLINNLPVDSPHWIPFRLVTSENYLDFLEK